MYNQPCTSCKKAVVFLHTLEKQMISNFTNVQMLNSFSNRWCKKSQDGDVALTVDFFCCVSHFPPSSTEPLLFIMYTEEPEEKPRPFNDEEEGAAGCSCSPVL